MCSFAVIYLLRTLFVTLYLFLSRCHSAVFGHIVDYKVTNKRSVSQLSTGTFRFHMGTLLREQ